MRTVVIEINSTIFAPIYKPFILLIIINTAVESLPINENINSFDVLPICNPPQLLVELLIYNKSALSDDSERVTPDPIVAEVILILASKFTVADPDVAPPF